MARFRVLRFSITTLLIMTALCCVGLWWWQRPFTVETPERLPSAFVNGQPSYETGRRVESFRRQLLANPIRHGPTRVFDTEERMIFEEHWRSGVRHGLYRRWGRDSGDPVLEMEFDGGLLVRVGDQFVEDFMSTVDSSDPKAGRIRAALEENTTLDYVDVPLRDVLDDIATRHAIPLRIDNRALASKEILSDAAVSAGLPAIPLFAAFCDTLAPLELTCRYQHEVLWVTTKDSHLLGQSRLTTAGEFEKQLAESTRLDYFEAGLNEILADLSRQHGIRFVSEADSERAVSLNLAGVSLRSALEILLYEWDMYAQADGDSVVIRAD